MTFSHSTSNFLAPVLTFLFPENILIVSIWPEVINMNLIIWSLLFHRKCIHATKVNHYRARSRHYHENSCYCVGSHHFNSRFVW